jgi:N-terminal acetyltransferase B complex non-catalytic subunit
LNKFSASANENVAEMYKRNNKLAVVETAFSTFDLKPPAGKNQPSARVATLALYLEESLDSPSIFDDVRPYVVVLTFEEAETLLGILSQSLDQETDKNRSILKRVLIIKLRYLLTTCGQAATSSSRTKGDRVAWEEVCKTCSHKASLPCRTCLETIVVDGCTTYTRLASVQNDKDTKLQSGAQLDLSMTIGMALLKLAGLQQQTDFSRSPLHGINIGLFLQAVLVFARQLRQTPQETPLRLVVVKLYLMLGCATRAQEHWIPMDVKRTIQDALGPHFFDRISSLSPGLFQRSTRALTEPLRKYYEKSLRDFPQAVWQAFQAGSYLSLIDMIEFDTKLRKSCTLVMTTMEERRATRSLGGKIEKEIKEIPFIGKRRGGEIFCIGG